MPDTKKQSETPELENQNPEQHQDQNQDQNQNPELAKALARIQSLEREITKRSELEQAQLQQQKQEQEEEKRRKLQEKTNLTKKFSENKIDLEELSRRELVEAIATAFDDAIDARTELITKETNTDIDSLTSKITNIEQFLVRNEAAKDMRVTREKYSDFDNYREEMSDIFNRFPGISAEEAYVLAKSQKSKGAPYQEDVESEKPDNHGTRTTNANRSRGERKEKKIIQNNKPLGRRGLRELINNAAEQIISNRR
ncbi:MAG: hypothetical protein ACTSYW_02610 [Candidatus Heimdallarchaeota archaeon]